jgi:hypothetical protein
MSRKTQGIRSFQSCCGVAQVNKTDPKFRKWNKPKAKKHQEAIDKSERREYGKRRARLVNIIVKALGQKRINGYLEATDIPSLLLLLKQAVDWYPGGFLARHPYPTRTGGSSLEQSERAMFMQDAFKLALQQRRIMLCRDGLFIYLYVHSMPKWFVHRNGQVLADYMPTADELAVGVESTQDIEPGMVFTDCVRAKLRQWHEHAA